jgi:membrane-associated phospholipid phosphatase
MEAWALATVIAREYPNKPLVKYGMYGFATAVSLSRITSQRHYASDVLVGSSIGYLIGRFVTRDVHPAVQQ